MWKSVVCAVCGKRGRVEIDDETKAIKSKWAYFGKVTRGKKEIEYWDVLSAIVRQNLLQKIP